MNLNEPKCDQMYLNKLKETWMNLNEPKQAEMGVNEPKWAQILITILPVMYISVRHDICYDF